MRNRRKREPWRMIAGIIAIVFITYMRAKKDIVSMHTDMPKQQIVPLVITSIGVTLLKVVSLAALIFAIKWIFYKLQNK